MSLWLKSPVAINFSDVDAFCRTMQPEGARLDYKGISFPKDVANDHRRVREHQERAI